MCTDSDEGNVGGQLWQEYYDWENKPGSPVWVSVPRLADSTLVWPTDLPSTIDKNFGNCKIYAHFKDHIIPTCGHVYKIRREWKLVDWCSDADTTLIEWIKVVDETAPEIPGNGGNSSTDGLKKHECKGEVYVETPDISYECWDETDRLHYTYTVTYPDRNHPGKDIIITSSITPSETHVIYLPDGWHDIVWVVSDLCGNHRDFTEQVHLVDNTPPTPVCDEITQTTLDPDECWARVYAKDLDDGSHDNCCQELHFAVASMAEIEYWTEYWKDEMIAGCGLDWYWDYKDEVDWKIERWINMFVFDEYIDVNGLWRGAVGTSGIRGMRSEAVRSSCIPRYAP